MEASRAIRSFIAHWVRERPERTVLLTTHYMVEADELCGRVAIIDHGTILALDTPRALKRALPEETIFVLLLNAPPPAGWSEGIHGIDSALVQPHQLTGGSELRLTLREDQVIGEVLGALRRREVEVLDLTKHEPSLESVFVHLVGRGLDQDAEAVEAAP